MHGDGTEPARKAEPKAASVSLGSGLVRGPGRMLGLASRAGRPRRGWVHLPAGPTSTTADGVRSRRIARQRGDRSNGLVLMAVQMMAPRWTCWLWPAQMQRGGAGVGCHVSGWLVLMGRRWSARGHKSSQ